MQLGLFGPVGGVRLRPLSEEMGRAVMPPSVRLGTSSWSFPGWPIWDGAYAEDRIAREGLAAYATHPCVGTVGVDRSYYRPLTAEQWRTYASQVPAGFRFLVKAPEETTVAVWPTHARYGSRGGTANARYLDAGWLVEAAVQPMVEGLGAAVGVKLLQFSPQEEVPDFLRRLEMLVAAVSRSGVRVAVEVRNPRLARTAFASAVRAGGGVPCLSVWGAMPRLAELRRAWGTDGDTLRVVRWMMPTGGDFTALERAYAPYDRVHRADDATRDAVLDAVFGAEEAWVIVDNKAEGSAILSVERLALRWHARARSGAG